MSEALKVTRRRLTVADHLAELDKQASKHNAALVKIAEKRAKLVEETRRQAESLLAQVTQ